MFIRVLFVSFIIVNLVACAVNPPKEYVGSWVSSKTSLKIDKSGNLVYTTYRYGGYRQTETPITSISKNEIKGLLFSSWDISGDPSIDENGNQYLIVDDEKLYKRKPRVKKSDRDEPLYCVSHIQECVLSEMIKSTAE